MLYRIACRIPWGIGHQDKIIKVMCLKKATAVQEDFVGFWGIIRAIVSNYDNTRCVIIVLAISQYVMQVIHMGLCCHSVKHIGPTINMKWACPGEFIVQAAMLVSHTHCLLSWGITKRLAPTTTPTCLSLTPTAC